jgi:hypothetical protein
MAVTGNIDLVLRFLESTSNDLGVASQAHTLTYPGSIRSGDYTSGTADNQQDLVWSDRRSLAATSEQLDLRGVLTAAIGGAAMSFVEVRGIAIVNRATAAASVLLVGGGANPAFSGLFGATGDIIKVPASGCLVWFAPLDGGGLATTAGTADMLTVDSGAATISYDIMVWGVSA